MEKQQITEEMNLQEQWYKDAREQFIDELPGFINHLLNDYNHDYGTICHALSAGAIATITAMNKSPQGGITGFQAGAIMWEFIRHWNYAGNKTGLSILDYDNFLYPQYEYRYQKTIRPDIWKAIQEQARIALEKADGDYTEYLAKRDVYKSDLADFIKKYPDYLERPEYYEKLGCGTGVQWDEYRKKVESGFEFAPSLPYLHVGLDSPVYKHWQSIVDGNIPFGYSISDD